MTSSFGANSFIPSNSGWPRGCELRKRKRTTVVEEDSSDVGEDELNSDLEIDTEWNLKEVVMDQGPRTKPWGHVW